MIEFAWATILSIAVGVGSSFIRRGRIHSLACFLAAQTALGFASYLILMGNHPDIAEEQPLVLPSLFGWWFVHIFGPGVVGFGISSLVRDDSAKKLGRRAILSAFDRLVTWAALALFLPLFCLSIPFEFIQRKAEAAVDYSAHAALTAEIFERLDSIPPGGSYPSTLSALLLTYPDGGNESLLERFTYESSGTACSVHTRLGGRETFQTFLLLDGKSPR